MRKLIVITLIALLIGLGLGHYIKAQTNTTYTIIATGLLANCAPIVAGQTQYCFAKEGLAQSLNGAAYVIMPVSATTAGVTSWNGLTGAVTYTAPTPPVTSVNGKTGAVSIAAVATAPTVTLQ